MKTSARWLVMGTMFAGLAGTVEGAEPPAAWSPLGTWKGHGSELNAIAFNPAGETLAALSSAGAVKVWDVVAGKEKLTLRNRARVLNLAYAPDGKSLLTVSREGILGTWDTASGAERAARRLPLRATLSHATFSADGKMVATIAAVGTGVGPDGGSVQVWDVATGRRSLALAGHEMMTFYGDFAPDGKSLATSGERFCEGPPTSSAGLEVKLWDLGNGKLLATLPGCATSRFSADGKRLVAQGWETTATAPRGLVKLWDLAARKEMSVLKGHVDSVAAVAFSPDGKLIASAGSDRVVKIWDCATGKEVATLKGHTGPVTAVAFSPDGKLIASAGGDRTVRLWAASAHANDGDK